MNFARCCSFCNFSQQRKVPLPFLTTLHTVKNEGPVHLRTDKLQLLLGFLLIVPDSWEIFPISFCDTNKRNRSLVCRTYGGNFVPSFFLSSLCFSNQQINASVEVSPYNRKKDGSPFCVLLNYAASNQHYQSVASNIVNNDELKKTI
jgi:hypothetical protein